MIGAKGCDLNDATVARACIYGVNEAVLAKREISRLWDDTTRTPYKALFNPTVSGSDIVSIHVLAGRGGGIQGPSVKSCRRTSSRLRPLLAAV